MTSLTTKTTKQKATFLVYYQCFLAICSIFVFFSSVTLALNAYGIGVPLFWLIGFIFLAAPLYPQKFKRLHYLPKSVFIWFAVYLAMTSIVLLAGPNSGAPIDQIVEDQIRTILFFSFMLILFSEHLIVHQCTRVAILLVSIFNVFLLIAQFLKPSLLLDIQDVPGRAGGFYIDSNMASCGLNMGLLFSIGLLKPKYRLFYALFILMGNAVTFSRGGMACWLLIVIMLMVLKIMPVNQLPLLIGAILTASIIVSSQVENLAYITTPDGEAIFNEGTIERVRFLANPFAEGEGVEEIQDDSRVVLVDMGLQKFASSPWYGSGLGSGTHSGVKADFGADPRSHNIYLDRMIEYGFLGVFIYPLLVFATVWKAQGEQRKYGIVFTTFAIFWGIMSHTVLTNFFVLTSLAFMAAMTKRSRIEHAAEQEETPQLKY